MRHLYRYISSSQYSDYSYACEPIDFFSVLRILTMSRVFLNCSCTEKFPPDRIYPIVVPTLYYHNDLLSCQSSMYATINNT